VARNYKPEGSAWYNGSVDADATAETLRSESFDLVVIGGGIIGTGVAWIAARAGLRVALCERDDLAAWTSSASSKLIHGGLRYLRMGDVKLVREAHTERRALARVVAPHLVRPLRFVMPLRADGPYGPVLIGAGMVAYGALSGFRDGPTLVVAPPRAHALAPALRTDGLRAGGVYHDHQTDDARLVVAVARAAAACGATIATRCEVIGLDVRNGRTSRVEVRSAAGEGITIRTRAVVNATGPWVDSLRRLEDARAGTSIQLSKGAHLVLETDERWPSAVTVPLDRVRVSFALPYNGMLVLGTTDEPYEGDPAAVLPNAADQERILGDTASTRRESVLSRGPGGMLSVAGGKYTTFRRIALDVVRALAPELGLHALDEHPAPLADAADPDTMAALLCTRPYALDPELALHLARLYGAAAPAVASLALDDASLLEPLHSASPDIGAQVVWARHAEWATEVDDVVRRRTSLVFRGHDDADVRARVATLLERPMPPAARAAA